MAPIQNETKHYFLGKTVTMQSKKKKIILIYSQNAMSD